MNREEVLLIDLPSEIIINILSLLPIRSIISCKCVCKSWLYLLSSSEFSKSHLLKSKPGLAVYSYERDSRLFKIFECEDSSDNLESHELHYKPVSKIDRSAFISHSNSSVCIGGSVNGFLFLRTTNTRYQCDIFYMSDALYICNPITRDYIDLPSPEGSVYNNQSVVTYGFGVSKMSGQHKVVRIFHDCVRNPEGHLLSIPKSICQVYTLGTVSWRSVAPGAPLEYSCASTVHGAFLHGSLHWLVTDLKGFHWISCFDLQTEVFSTFSPPYELQRSERFMAGLVGLGDCLCLCDSTSESEIVIWLMKEYGVEKSWTKEVVISKFPDFDGEADAVFYPIKVFKDGDILMALEDLCLLYYSSKSRQDLTIIDMFALHPPDIIRALSYTPSFVSLKCFTMEDVNSF